MVSPVSAVSHLGICVSDLGRSELFYIQALGFELEHYADLAPPFHVMTETDDLKGRAGFYRKGDLRIELVSYEVPPVSGARERRPIAQLGLSHLSLVVKDLAAAGTLIAEFGGAVLPHTRLDGTFGRMVFATDPDGIRLELWEKPLAAEA